MNLKNKKLLASKVLGVGKNRIKFNSDNLAEIKEAITKDDIKGLYSEGIISIKPIKGRKKIVRRKIRRGPGKIKIKIKHRKRDYVIMTRKLRRYLKTLKVQGKVDKETFLDIRKKIKIKNFKSKDSLKDYVENLKNLTNVKETRLKTKGRISIKKGKKK